MSTLAQIHQAQALRFQQILIATDFSMLHSEHSLMPLPSHGVMIPCYR